MQAERDDLVGLLHLQQIDMEILRQKKQLAELPQREAIMAARKKRAAVEEKLDQVAKLKKDATGRLARNTDEDDSLVRKEADVQAAIEATRADYRSVEARTKELAGIAKRRGTLAEDRAKIEEELAKIARLEAQVQLVIEEVGAVEARAVASFQEQGGALMSEIARLEAQRDQVAADVNDNMLALYRKTAERMGGVAIGVLSEGKCGVCRVPIDGGRLIDLKSQAPLGTCPACKRLLVIG